LPDAHSPLKKPNVLAVLPAVFPPAIIYTIRPMQAMEKRGEVSFSYALESQVTRSQILSSDVVVFVRNKEQKYRSVLDEAKANNILTVYDLDDNLWEIPKENASGKYHLEPARVRQFEHYLRSVDVVRVYNKYVADKVRGYNHNVFQATAGIDVGLFQEYPVQNGSDRIRIIYATGRGAKDELYTLIIDGLKAVLEKYQQKVEIILWHEGPEELVKYPNVRVLPYETSYEKFMSEMAAAQYDIGLAPLYDSAFYRSKTNTKFRDYGLCRIAGIYSDVEVYRNVEHEKTGLLVNNEIPGAWESAITCLIENETLRKEISVAAYQRVSADYNQSIMEAEWNRLLSDLTADRRKFSPRNEAQSPYYFRDRTLVGAKTEIKRLQIGGRGALLPGFSVLSASAIRPEESFDLTCPIPLPDNSVDEVLIVDGLQHVPDLWGALSEVYRVCKHQARVCVYEQYTYDHNNRTQLSGRPLFNEQTPRLWTKAADTLVYETEYTDDGPEPWGLIPAEKSGLIDFRCRRMEFFYAPEYRHVDSQEQREARRSDPDACDHILYHFMAVKQPITEAELKHVERTEGYFEPLQVTIRRYQEHNEWMEAEKDRLNTLLTDKAAQVETLNRTLGSIRSGHAAAASRQAQNSTLNRFRGKISRRFFNKEDAWGLLPEKYERLRIDSLSYYGGEREGFVLRPSIDLREVQFLEYPIQFQQSKIQEVLLAFDMDFPISYGIVGIEFVDPKENIVANTLLNGNLIPMDQPFKIQFEPVENVNAGLYRFRVFARNVDVPVRVLEQQKYTYFGFGRLHTRVFAAFA
jgi:glycosyltransferase involved in cell wall biosynthesis/SAM-dependent methyltransferase